MWSVELFFHQISTEHISSLWEYISEQNSELNSLLSFKGHEYSLYIKIFKNIE